MSHLPDVDKWTQMARLAWRNSARCIGRLSWQNLHVLDATWAESPEDVCSACVEHLRFSTNGGRIRAAITLFHPADSDGRGIRLWNRQLVRYAGYRMRDGGVLGDPEQVDFTAKAIELGWSPPAHRSAFDVLPLIIECPGRKPQWFCLPPDAVLEVPITHPHFDWFAALHLKWHALPAVSDMALVSEDTRFTAAPFSGYYMATEIASRNFGDAHRYNLLPVVAARMGLNLRSRLSLWQDRALVELNTAVLHSFRLAGVTIVDHHTASEQFMRHVANEERCGRTVPGDWSWLVPPLSGSSCPVFHRYYSSQRPVPAFVAQAQPW